MSERTIIIIAIALVGLYLFVIKPQAATTTTTTTGAGYVSPERQKEIDAQKDSLEREKLASAERQKVYGVFGSAVDNFLKWAAT
jgi:hypothetical protein